MVNLVVQATLSLLTQLSWPLGQCMNEICIFILFTLPLYFVSIGLSVNMMQWKYTMRFLQIDDLVTVCVYTMAWFIAW